MLRRHRGLASLLQGRFPLGPNGLTAVDRVLTVLLEAGFTPRQALAAFHTVTQLLAAAAARRSHQSHRRHCRTAMPG